MTDPTPIVDHALYTKLAEPYPNAPAAQAAVDDFIRKVLELREACRIPELLLIVGVHYRDGKRTESTVGMISRGDSAQAPTLAGLLFQRFARPLIDRARELEAMATGTPDDDAAPEETADLQARYTALDAEFRKVTREHGQMRAALFTLKPLVLGDAHKQQARIVARGLGEADPTEAP